VTIEATLARAYDRESPGYDAKFESQQRPKARGLARFVPVTSGRVLDVGCGTGLLRKVLCEVDPAWARASWTGLDFSSSMLRHASGYAVVQGDARKLPFVKASFDVVFSLTGVVLPEHVSASLVSAARVVKPGGIVAFSLRWDAWPPGFDGAALSSFDRLAWTALEGDQVLVLRRRIA